MTRSPMRDEIRALAEIEGTSTATGLINNIIQEVLDSLTGLARYDECYVPGNVVSIGTDGVVTLPTDLQHIDETEMWFRYQGLTDDGNRYRLMTYARWRNTNIGRANQFRFYGTGTTGAIVRKMLITPFVDIDTALDTVEMNYWRKLVFDTDATEFPISKLLETVMLKTAARIAKSSNTRIFQKLTAQAREAYAAARATSLVY